MNRTFAPHDSAKSFRSQPVRVDFKNPLLQPHILFSSRRKENVPLTVQEKRAVYRGKCGDSGLLSHLNIAKCRGKVQKEAARFLNIYSSSWEWSGPDRP